MTTFIVIGNAIAFLASIFMVISGFVKTKKKVLFCQNIELGLTVIAYIFLGAMSGLVINTINLIRNLLGYKERLNVWAKIVLTILSVVAVLYFNKHGLIGLLPLICGVIYLWLMTIKDVIKFKIMIICLMVLWVIYDFMVLNYTGSIFDVVTIIANIISIIGIKRSKKCSR